MLTVILDSLRRQQRNKSGYSNRAKYNATNQSMSIENNSSIKKDIKGFN